MGTSTLTAADLRKIDPRARHGLATGELSGSIEVLLRTVGAMSDGQRSELRAAGCDFRIAVGNVTTGVIGNAAQLEAVARLPFVRQVELSRPLTAE